MLHCYIAKLPQCNPAIQLYKWLQSIAVKCESNALHHQSQLQCNKCSKCSCTELNPKLSGGPDREREGHHHHNHSHHQKICLACSTKSKLSIAKNCQCTKKWASVHCEPCNVVELIRLRWAGTELSCATCVLQCAVCIVCIVCINKRVDCGHYNVLFEVCFVQSVLRMLRAFCCLKCVWMFCAVCVLSVLRIMYSLLIECFV